MELRSAHRRGAPWEIVVLDQHMPEMNGLMMAESLRAEPWGKDPVLILFTSIVGHLERERLEALGFAGYLTKPIRQSDMIDTISTAWGARLDARKLPLVTANVLDGQRSLQPHRDKKYARARVLVVEDNPVNQRVAAGLLELLGCRVDLAANGREAVDLVRRVPYEAIMMDVQMPVMDGTTATVAIREWEARTGRDRVPIIAMTAHAMSGDQERCYEAGMDGYLSKPVSFDDLAAELDRFLSARTQIPPKPPPAAVFDPEPLSLVVQGDPATAREMLELMDENVRTQLREMEAALEQSDLPAYRRAAHSLKGSAGMVGAMALHRRLAALMTEHDPDRLRHELEEMQTSYRSTRDAIVAWIEELSSETSGQGTCGPHGRTATS